ncbi:MAG: nucleotidyltransferase domain-containing protein [Chloroflexi bacterium]|nr:MAG: nucleotidyltransferase domain-containing protein [Chloroflexota bacterium]
MTSIHEPTPNAASPIQEISSPSVRIFWLDQNQVRSCLQQAVKRMVEKHPEVEEVWLFGSLARGDAVPGSDADLMVLLTESQLPFLERPLYYQLDFCGVGTDVLVYTRAELNRMQSAGNHFFQTVRSEGICLFRSSTFSEKSNF